jgi:hypothetical protein
MSRTQNQLIGFGLTLASAVLWLNAVQSTTAAEPVYNGKALSEWLVTMQTNSSDAAAIRQIGTNGLPALLDIISVEQWNRKKVLGKLKSKNFQEAAGNKNVPTKVFRRLALDGFSILGTNAEPAIPELKRLLYASPECRPEVASALVKIGPKGFAILTNAVNNNDMVGYLVETIGQEGGGDVQTASLVLISALKDSDAGVRGNAAYYLSGKDATLAVPALIPMLDDPQDYPRQRAALALGSFGPAAKSAVPKLWSHYTNSPDVFVMIALKSIDRETAGRAEEFLVNSGPLNEARFGYTRTKLTNGLELIAGGYIHTEIPAKTNRCLSNAELLDPKTGKWTKTGPMNTARSDHKATLLPDGTVLVVGGSDIKNNSISSKELYDPATGTWTMVTNK